MLSPWLPWMVGVTSMANCRMPPNINDAILSLSFKYSKYVVLLLFQKSLHLKMIILCLVLAINFHTLTLNILKFEIMPRCTQLIITMPRLVDRVVTWRYKLSFSTQSLILACLASPYISLMYEMRWDMWGIYTQRWQRLIFWSEMKYQIISPSSPLVYVNMKLE